MFFMKKIFVVIALAYAIGAFGQVPKMPLIFNDSITKHFRMAVHGAGVSPQQLSILRKASIYMSDLNIQSMPEDYKKLYEFFAPNIIYDIDVTNTYLNDEQHHTYIKELLTTEEKLSKADQKQFTDIAYDDRTAVDAAGFFLIGQYAYLDKDFKRAAKAFKLSKDIFVLNDAHELILARVEMATLLAELQARKEINLEDYVLTNGRLFTDPMGKKHIVNLLKLIVSVGGHVFRGELDPNGTFTLLVSIYNLHWNYGNSVYIRMDEAFRTPYIENSLAETLTTQQLPSNFFDSGDSECCINMDEATERQHLSMWKRTFKEPLINNLIFNEIIGANSLIDSHQKDVDLLHSYADVYDFILSKNDLRYQLETSTATLKQFIYDPTQPDTLQIELGQAIQNMSEETIAKSYLYRHLATLFYTHNQLDSAAYYIRKTYDIQKKWIPTMTKPRKQLIQGFFNYLEGNYADAHTLCKQALAIQKDDPTLSYTHHTLGLIYRAEGNTEAAVRHFEQAAAIIEQQTRTLQRGYCREFFVQLTYDVYENLVTEYKAQNRPEDVFSAVMKSKNNVFRQVVSQFTANAYTKDIQRINEYSTNKNTDEDIVKHTGELYALFWQSEKEYNQLQILHQAEIETAPITLKSIKKYLDNDEALLTFYTADNHLNCLITTPQNTQNVRLCTESQLEQDIKNYRTKFVDFCRKHDGAISKQGVFDAIHPIYNDVWKKIEQSGSIMGKELIIDPYGALHYFPFELIFSDNTPKEFSDYNYLINNHVIRYASDMSLLMNQTPHTYKKDLLAFGNPVFKGTLQAHELKQDELGYYRKHLRSLPNTKKEIEGIASQFPPERYDIYLEKNATEDQLKSLNSTGKLSDYRYVHFATHGLVNYRSPLLSTIALNQDDNFEEDGFLQFYEIDGGSMHLKAEMVVLSACETGLGKVIESEGVVGFGKAFMSAGAQSVILSKWQVNDSSTSDFFQDFYKILSDNPNGNKAQLLAELKRQRINEIPPFHWAGFVYYGN